MEVYRLALVRDLCCLPPANPDHPDAVRLGHVLLRNVRAVGIVAGTNGNSFVLDDGTACITVMTPGAPPSAGGLVEVFGLLNIAPPRSITANIVATRMDPMVECLRWLDIAHVYHQYRTGTDAVPTPPLLAPAGTHPQQRGAEDEGEESDGLDAAMLMCSSQVTEHDGAASQHRPLLASAVDEHDGPASQHLSPLASAIDDHVRALGAANLAAIAAAFPDRTTHELTGALEQLQQLGAVHFDGAAFAAL
eukprot:m.43620 g.43620  ORF g.43620 m.43620 type:complete len:249 (+) comp10798_c0_seq2:1947-2693(+)